MKFCKLDLVTFLSPLFLFLVLEHFARFLFSFYITFTQNIATERERKNRKEIWKLVSRRRRKRKKWRKCNDNKCSFYCHVNSQPKRLLNNRQKRILKKKTNFIFFSSSPKSHFNLKLSCHWVLFFVFFSL